MIDTKMSAEFFSFHILVSGIIHVYTGIHLWVERYLRESICSVKKDSA